MLAPFANATRFANAGKLFVTTLAADGNLNLSEFRNSFFRFSERLSLRRYV